MTVASRDWEWGKGAPDRGRVGRPRLTLETASAVQGTDSMAIGTGTIVAHPTSA